MDHDGVLTPHCNTFPKRAVAYPASFMFCGRKVLSSGTPNGTSARITAGAGENGDGNSVGNVRQSEPNKGEKAGEGERERECVCVCNKGRHSA